jgi:hypothetical protein
MSDGKESFVTTLLYPNEYARNLNQVSGLTTRNIVYLKRKFLSKSGYELVNYALADCVSITYKDERPLISIVSGVLLISLLSFIWFMLFKYWDSLAPSTRIPIGVLTLGAVYGFRAIFGARRHRLIFAMKDESRLVWRSRSGDYKYKQAGAAKVVDLAKSLCILTEPI